MILSLRLGPRYITFSISILNAYGAEWVKFQNTLVKSERITIPIIPVEKKNSEQKSNFLQDISIEKYYFS